MVRWSVEGQDTGSGVSKNGDHSRRTAAIRFYLLSSRQFSAHPQSSLGRIDKRTARAARNTRYPLQSNRPSGPQNGPVPNRPSRLCGHKAPRINHKMADNRVSLPPTRHTQNNAPQAKVRTDCFSASL